MLFLFISFVFSPILLSIISWMTECQLRFDHSVNEDLLALNDRHADEFIRTSESGRTKLNRKWSRWSSGTDGSLFGTVEYAAWMIGPNNEWKWSEYAFESYLTYRRGTWASGLRASGGLSSAWRHRKWRKALSPRGPPISQCRVPRQVPALLSSLQNYSKENKKLISLNQHRLALLKMHHININ